MNPPADPGSGGVPMQRAFNRRPVCTAAIGVLFGTLLVRALPPPDCFTASLALLAASVAAVWCNRRALALPLLCMAAALVNAGLRYPPGGAFPYTGPVIELTGKGFGGELLALRAAVSERIFALFPENGGVACGMLLGDKSGIAKETIAAFQGAGVMHLLAISGLHVSILAGALLLLLRGNPWVRFGAVAAFLALYAALTAFSPSVVRAGVMLLVCALAVPLRKRNDLPTSLSLAFLIIVLIRPESLFYTGFQLSFCAVYGLLLLARPLQRPLLRLGSAASGLLASSLAVTIATLPVMARSFGYVQPLSVLANLFILPIVPLFMVPAFAGVALSYVCLPLGGALTRFAGLMLDLIMALSRAGGGTDLALGAPNAAASLAYLAALPFCSPLCLLDEASRLRRFLLLMGASAFFWIAG